MLAHIFGLGILALFLVGCEEKEFDPNDPAKSYGIAKEPYDDENYEIAIQRLGEFKSRFPYSKFAVEAELLLANAQYELGKYAEAAVSYEQFVKLHPKHPKVDFASFRVGESYWEDAPEEVDREQDYTLKAVNEWEKLINKMPNSPYAKKARELVKVGKRRVADSIDFVAAFYCKQEIYHACAYRSIELTDEYPEFYDLRLAALERAILSLDKVAEAKVADPESDKNLYFKHMTAEQIREKAGNMRRLLEDHKRQAAAKK